MTWDAGSTTDPSGVVLWWTRVPGNRLAEVHHLRSYRGRLRVWEKRGHGALIYDEAVHIRRDGRQGPDRDDVLLWQSKLRTLPPAMSDGAPS